MDQDLLDTSRYKISTLSIDSRFADRQFACTGDFQIRMPSATKNIMRVALSSVEIPNAEWVFSAANGNTIFSTSVDNGANWTEQTIDERNYTPSALVTAVHSKLLTAIPGSSLTLNATTGKVTLTLPAGAIVQWYDPNSALRTRSTYWGLGYYLGFRAPVSGAGGTIYGASIVTTASNSYYLLQLLIPDPLESLQHRLYDGSWVGAFAKVVLRDGAYRAMEFDDGGNMLRKEFTFLSPTNITNLRIRLLDPFGEVVNLHDVNWSLTLELYEVTNSRVYSNIAETFQRGRL